VEGAWFIDGVTRMDDQQHALAGLLRTIPIVEAGSSEDGEAVPSGWLWALALVLALNPAHAAFGVPRRSSPSAVELAAVGGVIGGLAVCAAAALGGPLLEALDVSEPSFRLAAGTVAVLAGAADLFRRPPASEPALAGWRAVFVPVAIPLVARPALLVLALGAGADRGVLVSGGALAVALALLVGLAARSPTEGPGGRVLRWAARLLAAALVACGALLAVDGVLDV
jgi:small neutral amino acid transporter SnatA (MarC family)